MKKSFILLFVFTLIISACNSSTTPAPSQSAPTSTKTEVPPTKIPSTPTLTPLPPTPTLAPETDFIKGVAFADWGLGDGLSSLDGQIVLRDIVRPLGANWIAIGVPCRMDVKNPAAAFECDFNDALSEVDIQKITAFAHSIGLRVAFLAIAIDAVGLPGNWVANLDYGSDENSWSMFFNSYTTAMLPYAELAEQENIDMLIIGGEMTIAQKQEKHWRELIAQIRSIYHGPITYASWCQHFDSVKWWDAVDYIGINIYCYPMSTLAEPTYDDTKQQFIKLLTGFKVGASPWQKQVIFTEIGFVSMDGVAKYTMTGARPIRLDVEEQELMFRGFFDALQEIGNEDQWLKGMFWYNYSSNPLAGGKGDINFIPQHKPAEEYLRAFYTGIPITPTTPPDVIQVEADQIDTSYWLFDDAVEHDVQITEWTAKGKHTVVEDPLGERGRVIMLRNIEHQEGLSLMFSPINLRDYDYIEFYLYSPLIEPNLEIRFDDSVGNYIPRRLYVRSYIDHEPLLDNKWHRIQIPVELLFPHDRNDIPATITTLSLLHMWPGQSEPFTFYIDDVRLIAIKNRVSYGPSFTEDPDNSMYLYRDGLENGWQMWTDEGGMTLSDLNAAPGYQGSSSALVKLSQVGTLTLINGPIDMSIYKWLEFYIKIGNNSPKSLLVGIGDWSPTASPYLRLLVDMPSFIEGGKYQPGTWQRVRIPLSYLGITDQIFTTPAFSIRNCAGWPCDASSIADDIYIDNIRLVAGK